AVVLGTAFVSGSFVFTDTLHRAFDNVFADVAKGVDVQVSADSEAGSGVDVQVSADSEAGSGVPSAYAETIRALPQAGTVLTQVSGPVVLVDAAGKPVQTGGAPSVGTAYI